MSGPLTPSLGEMIDRLAQTMAERATAPAEQSYTAALVQAGPGRCAKKLGEEAIEAGLAGVAGTDGELASEAADVIFHLLALLLARTIAPEAVAAELLRRTGTSGHAEKAGRTAEGDQGRVADCLRKNT